MNIFAMELAILGCAILNCLRGAVFLGTDNWMENCAVVLNLLLVVTLATQVSSPKSRYDGGEFTVLFLPEPLVFRSRRLQPQLKRDCES